MTAKVRIIVAALILTALLAPAGAEAEDPAANPPNTGGPIIAESSLPIATGHFAVQPFWGLSFTRGNFSPSWRNTSAGGNFSSLVTLLRLTYGPCKDLEVDVDIPAIQNWAGRVDNAVNGNRSADFGGLGDTALIFKYLLFQESDWRPTITPFFSVTFPTGHAAKLNPGRLGADDLGSGAYTFTPGLLFSKWMSPFILYANLFYSVPTNAPPQVKQSEFGPLLPTVTHRGQVNFNLAAEWVITPRWMVLLEFYSSWEMTPLIRPQIGPPGALLGVLPGLEFVLSPKWNIEAGVAVDLAGKNSPYNITPIVTTTFTY